ncbi:zinc finger protein RFP-like isoform X1 [Rhineura floridana]|uniref:zinc finger protein RFP-like isoform X1 n=1 Tax=Rhineura floridana TaxID=261503 RepID=UPI002AC86E40|nr:zinc finger protein RFP-like isoform X1 [Rhineura floridana]XP_061475356.1 zinc finger protein RFP-like isoform X1 [Rhineura floridana]
MATDNLKKRLREEMTCSVCQDFFLDPVILDCQHSFCSACIAQYWEDSSTNILCPVCKWAISGKRFKPNKQLASFVEITKQLNNQERMKAEGKQICERHEEPLKLFCKDEQVPICVMCDRSKEHRGHNVVPKEEAAQEYKDRMCSSLETLRKQREKMLVYKSNAEKENQDLLKQIESEQGKLTAEFKELYDILKKQSSLLVAQMECANKEIVKNRNEQVDRLTQELSSLDGIIRETEEKSQLPVDELLQGIKGTFLLATCPSCGINQRPIF